ncbi:MAG: molybdopterin-dependent oxidoreductase [Chitinophagales bacterium]
MNKIDKHPDFLVHTTAPVNAEPPAATLREHYITPSQLFYIRNHGEIPEIDPYTFRLQVNGMVERELVLSLEMLRNDFFKHTVMATLQCAGNRRDQLIEVAPIPGEVPWQSGAIGNEVWSGARLSEVLKAAGIKDGAAYVEFMGADDVYRKDENVGFGGSIPIEKAISADVLLAYEMNGKPLDPTHGFPLRTIVPGYIGARSVKWLSRITLQEQPSSNYFQSHAYQLFPSHINGDTVDWNSGLQLSELSVNCVITSPQNGEAVKGDSLLLKGYAMSGGGRKICRVDVSVNGGQSWLTATITHGDHPWAWTFWEVPVQLPTGNHEIIARAFDTACNTQPEDAKQVWNFKGYMNNAWHRIKLEIKGA